MKLQHQWIARLKLRAQDVKLRIEGAKLRTKGAQLWAEGDKLCAEGVKLRIESDKLRAESDKLWAEAIIEAYGNIRLEWKYRDGIFDCELENGDFYRGDAEIDGAQS